MQKIINYIYAKKIKNENIECIIVEYEQSK